MNNDTILNELLELDRQYKTTGKRTKAYLERLADIQTRILQELLATNKHVVGTLEICVEQNEKLLEINHQIGAERDEFAALALEHLPCDTWA